MRTVIGDGILLSWRRVVISFFFSSPTFFLSLCLSVFFSSSFSPKFTKRFKLDIVNLIPQVLVTPWFTHSFLPPLFFPSFRSFNPPFSSIVIAFRFIRLFFDWIKGQLLDVDGWHISPWYMEHYERGGNLSNSTRDGLDQTICQSSCTSSHW